MQLPVQKFDILTPGQMNPFNQALASGLDTYQNMVKAAYAPKLAQSEIASKAAYATYSPYTNLINALKNPGTIYALSKNPTQLQAVLEKLGTMPTNPYASLEDSNNGSVWDTLKEWTGLGGKKSQAAPVQPEALPETNIPNDSAASANRGMSYDAQGNNVKPSDAEVKQIADKAGETVPAEGPPSSTPSQAPTMGSPADIQQNAYGQWFPHSQTATDLKKKQDFETARAHENSKTITELGDVINHTAARLNNINKIKELIHTPMMENIRKVALAKGYELEYFANFGTKEQKKFVGELKSRLGQVVQQTAGEYKGAFRQGEQSLIEGYKPAEGDMPDVMIGKTEGMYDITNFLNQRSRLTAQYMLAGKDNIQAQDLADAKLNGDAVRKKALEFSDYNKAPKGSWPVDKAPINANELEGQRPPEGTVWMITPKGKQVPVHTENVQTAKDKYRFRGINEQR